MSIKISESDIQDAYDAASDIKELADAVFVLADGVSTYKNSEIGSLSQKRAIIQIFQGAFSVAELGVGDSMYGAWSISTGSKLLDIIADDTFYRVQANQIRQELYGDWCDDVNDARKQAAVAAWDRVMADKATLKMAIDQMCGICAEVEEDDKAEFDLIKLLVSGYNKIKSLFDKTESAKCDPLVIDVYGSGFDTISVDDGVYFDLDNEGLTEKTGWVNGAVNGFLAHDLDEDGTISDGTELFTDQTMLSDGLIAESGFAALADLDMNGDGVISAEDEAFSELSIWQDINGNGYTDEGELKSLAEHGITSISLSASSDGTVLESGAVLEKTAAVSFTDGTVTGLYVSSILAVFKEPITAELKLSTHPTIDSDRAIIAENKFLPHKIFPLYVDVVIPSLTSSLLSL